MGVITLQGHNVRLVAGVANSGSIWDAGTVLDLYSSEEILINNNTTELFDLGAVPATYVKNLLLPGTKKNNAFFQGVTNFDLVNPQQWESTNKVRAYLDFNNHILVDGYIKVNKVNVYQNKFVDSYDVSIFGIISNISADLKTKFLTDTQGLSKYNFTASWAAATASWQGNLFNGDVIMVMADAGQKYFYSSEVNVGLDEAEGAVHLRDLKPAVRVSKVWDAMLEDSGYTSTGSFWMQPWLNDVYLIANNNKDSLIIRKDGEITDLYQYGTFKLNKQASNNVVTSSVAYPLKDLSFTGVEYNKNIKYDGNTGIYHLDSDSPLKGSIKLNFTVEGVSLPGTIPTYPRQAQILVKRASDGNIMKTVELEKISSKYRRAIESPFSSSYQSANSNNTNNTFNQSFELEQEFDTGFLVSGSYKFNLFFAQGGLGSDFHIQIDSGSNAPESYFSIDKISYAADGYVIDMPANMPAGGEGGIKQIDLLTGIQKKFNLCIYQNKTIPNQIICETFNEFYKLGKVKDFNRFTNEDEPITIEPLNNHTIAKVQFSDKKDSDYVSTVFEREYGRTFGAAFYQDTSSYYSQGEFKVETTLASAPLVAVPGMASTAEVGTCTTYGLSNTSLTETSVTFGYSSCATGETILVDVPPNSSIDVCSRVPAYKMSYNASVWGTIVEKQPCGTYSTVVPEPNTLYIPYYIADDKFKSATVLPRLMFYNGQKECEPFHFNGLDVAYSSTSSVYPYVDNYSAEDTKIGPTTSSRSLLFTNETPIFGVAPTSSLLSFWDAYLQLYYKSDAKLMKVSGIIPLAAYNTLELNDLVSYRSNLYHLRAVNDYSLTSGECKLELLGPIIPDALSSILNGYGGDSTLITQVWDTNAEIWNLSTLTWDL